MRCVVTGGAGFIGSHLVDRLLKEGHEVVVIDIKKSRYVNKDALFYKENILNREKIVELTKEADFIFHFAADPDVKNSRYNIYDKINVNLIGTINLLEAARRNDIKNFIFASSSTVYGIVDKFPINEEVRYNPISVYGATKASSDMFLSAYANSFGLNCTSLIFANIYGPRSNHGVIYDFYNKLKKDGSKLEILGNGKQKKSYLYINDAIDAIIIAMNHMKRYSYYNIGSEEWHTVVEIADLVSNILGKNPKYIFSGGESGWVGDVPKFILDVKKIKSLGWEEKVSFEEGVRRYITFLEHH